jgi:hypothetical protein
VPARRKRKDWAITTLGGMGAALAVLSTPVGLLEMIVASLGLSEILPAAAPPLGLKARALLALFAALMTAGIVALTRRADTVSVHRPEDEGAPENAPGARKMGFALSKLTALARGRAWRAADPELPTLRRADAHPDAPARTPIFASRDFVGLDIFARTDPGRRELVVKAEPEQDPVVPAIGLDMPSAPPPLPDESLPSIAPAPVSVATDPAPLGRPDAEPDLPRFVDPEPALLDRPVAARPVADASALSVAELTERLERGLALRRRAPEPAVAPQPAAPVLAAVPPAPAVAVEPAVAEDVDEALRAALGTLRTMTARGR